MALEQFLTVWGLPAIFAGSIVEGDTVAFLGGVLAHRGMFPFAVVTLAAALGAFLIDQVLFHMGRHLSRFPRARRALDRPAAQKLLSWLHRHPDLMGVSFRLLYGLKTVGALSFGASNVSALRFAVLDAIGCVIWAAVMTALGYGAGRAIETLFGRLALHHHLGLSAAVVVVLVGLAGLSIHRRYFR